MTVLETIKKDEEKKDNKRSKSLEELYPYIESIISVAKIGPLNQPKLQAVLTAVMIAAFKNPYEAGSDILKAIHRHCQAKEHTEELENLEIPDEIRNAKVGNVEK